MNDIAKGRPSQQFGGQWTIDKLNILESYLDAYSTALKDQQFKLMYIDVFAGTGLIELPGRDDDAEVQDFVSGSAERAIKIADKPFDKLTFVEKNQKRYAHLQSLRASHPARNIEVNNSEANSFLHNLDEDWSKWRGVLFLDPFATEVEWSTIETIAGFNALDTWILFPLSAVARMLPTSKAPENIELKWAERLTRVFGDETWRGLYQESPQGELFGSAGVERKPGVDGLLSIYKRNLEGLFGKRFLQNSRTLKNSRNSHLFEFLFCVGSPQPRAIDAAKRIANHILERM